MTNTILGLSFYTHDAANIATFWADTLGRQVRDGATAEFAAIPDPNGGPTLMFHKVPESKTVKNRLHLDLKASDFDTESQKLLDNGATLLTTLADNDGGWAKFADPDGNEFDLVP